MATEVKESNSVRTGVVRVSWPKLFKPEVQKNDDGTEKQIWSVVLSLPKDDPETDKVRKMVANKVKEKWPDKVPGGFRKAFRDGDTDEVYSNRPEFKGMWVVSCRSNRPIHPVKFNPDKSDGASKFVKIEKPEEFYAGCYVIAELNAYTYDMPMSKGVSVGLVNIVKVRDGVPLASGRTVDESFGDLDSSQYDELANSEEFTDDDLDV